MGIASSDMRVGCSSSVINLVILILPAVASWELSLLHVNDIHARMEETNKYSSKCKEKDKVKGKCYGGLARMYTAVKNIRDQEENVLWLNAGDFYQGTVWYTQFKWDLVSQFNHRLNFSAMTIGNHEFDDQLDGLIPFLQAQKCPVILTNLDTSLVPQLDGLYRPSVVLQVGSKRVGLVGYLTPSTLYTSNPPPGLVIMDEVESLTKEVKKLHDDGVDIIVAIGHSGYVTDMKVAKEVPHVDIVVGAHSHYFLFTEDEDVKNPSNNAIKGPYPTVVKNDDGHDVLVVQAFAFTKYLGHIRVEFDEAGAVESWVGKPILLDNKIEEDEDILEALKPWKSELNLIVKKIIGETQVNITKERDKENNIGSFATEAMKWSYRDKVKEDGTRYNMAMINSGGLRADIGTGNITVGDIMTILPFDGTFDMVRVAGRHLADAFEHSVAKFSSDGRNRAGQFLQVNGFKLVYDIHLPAGQRLISAKVLSDDGYRDLEEDDEYDILVSSYLAAGGDGYADISDHKLKHEIGPLDTDVIRNYLEATSPIQPMVKGNIIFKETGRDEPDDGSCWSLPVPGLDVSISFCGWSAGFVYH